MNWQNLDRSAIIDLLKKYQRLLRLNPNPEVAKKLLNPTPRSSAVRAENASASQPLATLDSAHAIAAIPETEFIQNYSATVGSEAAAKEIYQNATAVKAKTIQLWANIHNSVASPHFRTMRVNNVADDVHQFQNLPSYQDLFGSLDYCECEHCRSIFSPAAYFVDLMRITDEQITTKNNIPETFQLNKRRPDLAQIPLTCENTNTLVPYLDIVNKVLALKVDGFNNPNSSTTEDQKIDNAYKFLATATYPFNLPFNLPLEQIRGNLRQLNTNLATIYQTFNGEEKHIAREYLGLSIEEYNLITTSKATAADLSKVYGVDVSTSDLGGLINVDKFLHQTGLSRQELNDLLYQNLSPEEITSGLAHNFYINQVLPGNQYLSYPNTINNLNLATLDRINRFVRFAKKLNWSFADLDWVLHSTGVTGIKDIDENAIIQIAKIKQIAETLNLPLDVVCSLISDLKTIGVADPKNSQALFDVIFNNNKLLQGQASYHPTYARNPLYKGTVLSTSDLNNKTRIAAGLGISLDDLTSLINAFLDKDNNQDLDVPNLSILYRHSKLASILRLTIEQYLILLQLINKKKSIFTIQDLIEILDNVIWLSNLGFNVYELDYILQGNESKSISNKYNDEDIKLFLKNIWVLNIDLKPEFQVDLQINDIEWYRFIPVIQEIQKDTSLGNSVLNLVALFPQDIQDLIMKQNVDALTEDTKNKITQALNAILKSRDFYQPNRFQNLEVIPNDVKTLLSSITSLSENEVYRLNIQILLAFFNSITNGSYLVEQAVFNINQSKERLIKKQVALVDNLTAAFLGSSTAMINAAMKFIHQFTSLPNGFNSYIDVFLKPLQDSEFNDNNQSWKYIKVVLHSLSRFLLLNQKLQLSQTEIDSVINHPSCYGISFPQPSSITDISINIGDVKNLYTLKQLLKVFNDTDDQLIQYFAQYKPNNPDYAYLAKITGWKQGQIDDLVKNHNFSISSVEGITKLKKAFDLSHALGVDISFFDQILALKNQGINDTNWTTYTNIAQSISAILKAKYNDNDWAKISDKINGEIDELKRNALTTFTLWKLNQHQQDKSIKNLRDLSEYLLIDVETTGVVSVSYIKQAILSIQMYLQRCRLNLEPGVNNVNIPDVWWEWMMNYRVWEANRKVFLYPENYIEPNLRKSKSDLFQEFEAELLQSDITQESVEAAYHNYFDKLAELAKLKIASTYRCFVKKANNPDPVDTLFIFGKTTTEPVTYYYRECPVKKGQTYNDDSIIWDYWSKIDVNIKSDYISPVFAFNKLFIFWVEIKETTETTSNNGTTQKTTKQTATIKYTFQTVSKKWIQPQTLSQDVAIPYDNLTWKEVYPISVCFNNSEEILTTLGHFKWLQNSYQFDQPATILNANLLKDSQSLAVNQPILLDNHICKFLADHLVAYWPLNEGSGTTINDQAGNNQGTLLRTANWKTATNFPGGSRTVLQFNGTDNFVGLSAMEIDYSQGFTVAAWVYYDEFKNNSRIIDFGNAQSDNIILFNDGTFGNLIFCIRIGNNNDKRFTASNVLTANVWMHIVATVDSFGKGNIYINGKLKKSDTLNVPSNVKRDSNLIGGSNFQNPNSPEQNFKGQMAEVCICNKALSDTEVIALFKQISPNLLKNIPSSLLQKNNTSIFLVKNQPDWFTFDSGDEAFLLIPPNSQIKPINEDLTIPSSDSQINLSYNRLLTIPNNFRFTRLTTNILSNLSQKAFMGGIDYLLTLDSQLTPELSFSRFNLPDSYTPTHDRLDFHGAFGLYFQEIFFHIPFLVANTLNTNQRFAEAQKWYHYIFNPTQKNDETNSTNPSDRFWRYLPFRNNTLESLQSILSNQQAIAAYNNDPFDPHAIAQLRIGAYQKAIVMKYIDNLLDWGDNLFAQDTWESITQATMLYLLAYDLLGPKPENLGKCKVSQPATFQDIKNKYKEEIPQFLIELENKLANSPTSILTGTPFNDINAYFGVSENEQFIAYWDRVEDRLYKIRHSQNIEGIMRQLALYEPPIDPSQLVRAVAGGNVPMSVVSGLTADVPHYRFEYMLERARNLVSTVIQLGSSLLSALEKKDAEQISLLRATQESAILRLIQTTKEKQIKEAEENINSLNKSLEAANHRVTHFQTLINGGLNAGEISGIALAGTAIGFETTATIFNTLAAPAYLIPNVYGLANGGMNFGATVATLGAASSGIANTLNQGSALAGTIAQYQRRAEDWQLQLQMAQDDVTLINQQIVATQINLEIATFELKIHQKSIEQANEVEDFFKNKFSNQDLYQWMVSRLSLLYFQTFKIALDMTLTAQKAYQYELNKDDTYITFDYWDSLKKGLLAGEGLMLGLNQLEKAYIEGNQRRLEIEKTISLKELLGVNKFDEAKQLGKWEFELNEELFEQDYHGHYCRQIKTISSSIPAVVGPYENIKATLTQLSDTIYLTALTQDKSESRKSRKSWRRNQKIALSKGVNDSGLFELNFRDERYLPFEGTGAISTWQLNLPKDTNSENILNNLSDIIIHLSYTALDGN